MTRRIVGFTGAAGSGKTTAASVYVDKGWTPVVLADGLKAMLRTFLLWQGVDEDTATRMLDGDLKEWPSHYLCRNSPRYAMQTLGTEWGRDLISPTIWADAARRKIASIAGDVVIADVRFPNEVEMIRSLGGSIVRVERRLPGGHAHSSETQIASLDVDTTIVNDFASADDFRRWVSETAGAI